MERHHITTEEQLRTLTESILDMYSNRIIEANKKNFEEITRPLMDMIDHKETLAAWMVEFKLRPEGRKLYFVPILTVLNTIALIILIFKK